MAECVSFEELRVGVEQRPLSRGVLEFLKSQNIAKCSPVQQAAISTFLGNNDVAVEACTGSGKTLAFLIPIAERLQKLKATDLSLPSDPSKCAIIAALILAPTRELVQQIHAILKDLLDSVNQHPTDSETVDNGRKRNKDTDPHGEDEEEEEEEDEDEDDRKPKKIVFYSLDMFGGRPTTTDAQVFSKRLAKALAIKTETQRSERTARLALGALCATPGRLKTHLDGNDILKLDRDWTFRNLEVLVLDEADRLFSETAFQTQLRSCLQVLPRQRRTGVFSATLTSEIQNLALSGLRNPLLIQLKLSVSTKQKQALGSQLKGTQLKEETVKGKRRGTKEEGSSQVEEEEDEASDADEDLKALDAELRKRSGIKSESQSQNGEQDVDSNTDAGSAADRESDSESESELEVESEVEAGSKEAETVTESEDADEQKAEAEAEIETEAGRTAEPKAQTKTVAGCQLPLSLHNWYAIVQTQEKLPFLMKVLAARSGFLGDCRKLLVFLPTCNEVDFYHMIFEKIFLGHTELKHRLLGAGGEGRSSSVEIRIAKLHGGMPRSKRRKHIDLFNQVTTPPKSKNAVGSKIAVVSKTGVASKAGVERDVDKCVMFASDLAARGLDFDGIDLVLQLSPANDPVSTIHRMGRTARAGSSGHSLLLLTPQESDYLTFLRKQGVTLKPLMGRDSMAEDGVSGLQKAPSLESLSPDFCLQPTAAGAPSASASVRESESVTQTTIAPLSLKDLTPLTQAKAEVKAEAKAEVKAEVKTEGNAEALVSAEAGVSACGIVSAEESLTMTRLLRLACCSERGIWETAKDAFVSHIRYYKEHRLRYIFSMKRLDFAALANGMGLPRLPRVKEILSVKIEGFAPEKNVDPETVRFSDPALQAKFEKTLDRREKLKEVKVEKHKEVIKMQRKKKEENRTPATKKRKRRQVAESDWHDLQKEERLARKLKQNKISKEEFDELLEV